MANAGPVGVSQGASRWQGAVMGGTQRSANGVTVRVPLVPAAQTLNTYELSSMESQASQLAKCQASGGGQRPGCVRAI